MTLVVTVNGPDSIWAVADRRLSYPNGTFKDDARKLMFLETTDGRAILSYAGLGATGLGTEPSDWISRVLRGVNVPMEQSLGILADAMKRQFPQKMVRMMGTDGPSHTLVATSFVNGEPRVYTIDLAFTPDRRKYDFRYTRHVAQPTRSGSQRTPRIAVSGTGGLHLAYRAERGWMRELLRIVNAHDRGVVSARAVSDHMAALNNEVHLGMHDSTVGPKCIVAWRYGRKQGGGHAFYSGTTPDASSASLPTILTGTDLNALVGVLFSDVQGTFDALKRGQPGEAEMDVAAINERLSRLPSAPDERFC